ncbi:RDD family protein [Streptomyces sp. NPDC005423]|uniref:RDD family protein n=1 Tax=Streptomyces sp. NPDC005423 TaxID=3155343 RepID=UPI00339EBB38
MSAPTPAPGDDRPREGYYPDPSIPGYVRYWNGTAWVPGTSRPAPTDGLPLPAPSVEETGPHFFDEDPAPQSRVSPAEAQHGSRPEPASAWGADRSRQTGFGGDPDRRVSWGSPQGPDPRVANEPRSVPDGPPAEPDSPGTFVFRRPGTEHPAPAADEGTVTFRPDRQPGAPGARQEGAGNVGADGASGPGFGAGKAAAARAAAVHAQAAGADPAHPGSPAAPAGPHPGGLLPSAQGGPQAAGRPGGPPAARQGPAVAPRGAPAPPGQGGPPEPRQGPGVPPQGGAPAPQPGLPGPGQGGSAAARQGAAVPPGPRQPGPAVRPQAASAVPQQPGPAQPQAASGPTPMATGVGGGQPSWAQQVHRLAGADEGPVLPWKPPVEDVFQAAARRQSEARPAGLGRRLAARLVDTVVLAGVTGSAAVPLGTRALAHINDKIDAAKLSGRTETVWLLDGTTSVCLGVVLAVLLLFGVLYEALPTAKWGRTLGKKLCGLEVRGIESHDSPAFGAAVRRWLVFSVPGLLGIGVVGVAWCLFDRPWRQCWHDKAARTFVAG